MTGLEFDLLEYDLLIHKVPFLETYTSTLDVFELFVARLINPRVQNTRSRILAFDTTLT